MTAKVLTTTEELLRNRDYAAALSSLEAVDTSLLSRRDYGFYCILLAEVRAHLGIYEEELVDKAVEVFRHSSETDLFARAKFVKGWIFSLKGNHAEANETLLEAYVSYVRCDDKKNSARALNRLAYGAFQTGNADTAAAYLLKAVALYEDLGDDASAQNSAHNLAYVQFAFGLLCDAIATYARHPMSEAKNGRKDTLIFFSMSSVAHVLKGEFGIAREKLAKCASGLDEFPRDKAVFFENLGLLELSEGNYETAEQALEAGLKLSLDIAPESALISQTKRLMADVYLATGKLKKARKLATEALAVAEKINERVEIAACYRIFAQVEQVEGTAEDAGDWYKKAIDILSLISSRYELAVTRFLAAESGLFPQGETMAMFHLAREYLASEQIEHYIEKVDAAMRQPVSSYTTPVDKSSDGCPTIITVNEEMKKLLDLAEHVGQSEMTVFLTGDTGTGKDLLARYIHFCSGRKGEFVTVNAAAIPNPMIEAELFGHTKGAFTSADKDRKGLIEQADNGTFYLNEIADATPEFQAKLLEVLETRQVRRLGSNKSTKVNFRLIAATNHDLKARMHDGHFRVDLYHRLNEIPLTLPPLSARTEDIPLLVEYFLTDSGSKPNGDAKALERLSAALRLQDFPGNVRELQARVGHLAMVSRGNMDRMIELAQQSESERDRLLHALESCDWNRTRAARMLGVSEGAIRKRIRKFDLSQV